MQGCTFDAAVHDSNARGVIEVHHLGWRLTQWLGVDRIGGDEQSIVMFHGQQHHNVRTGDTRRLPDGSSTEIFDWAGHYFGPALSKVNALPPLGECLKLSGQPETSGIRIALLPAHG